MCYPEMRAAVIGTIIVAVLAQSACIDHNRETSSSTARATLVESGDAEQPKAGEKPPPSIVQPTLVTEAGNATIRTYVLHIGDAMEGVYGDVWTLRAVKKDGIVLGDGSELTLPSSARDHAVGKQEYLTIVWVHPKAASVKCKLKFAPSVENGGIIEPVKVTSEKHFLMKSKKRLFVLKPGQGFQLERDGAVVLVRIDERYIIFRRTFGMPIPIDDRCDRHMGNHEHMRIISVTREPPTVEVEVTANTSPLHILSF